MVRALLVVPLTLMGCMTMRGGPSQVIEIQTTPPGAKVIIQPAGGEYESPARVSLNRKSPYTVALSKPGFRAVSVPIENKISKGTWLRNIVWIHPMFWGAGVIVDLSTGAGYELIPESISIEMEAQTESSHLPQLTPELEPGSHETGRQ